jgi:hypothetical protein
MQVALKWTEQDMNVKEQQCGAATCTIGSRSPTVVCSKVQMPDMKNVVWMTWARSSGVPPIAGTRRKGTKTVDPSMVR